MEEACGGVDEKLLGVWAGGCGDRDGGVASWYVNGSFRRGTWAGGCVIWDGIWDELMMFRAPLLFSFSYSPVTPVGFVLVLARRL